MRTTTDQQPRRRLGQLVSRVRQWWARRRRPAPVASAWRAWGTSDGGTPIWSRPLTHEEVSDLRAEMQERLARDGAWLQRSRAFWRR